MPDEIVILVTCPASEAEGIASDLVERQLVACVNLIPGVTSIYRWENKTCKEQETLMVMKSNRRVWNSLESRIREIHSYDVPEIICIPIELAHKPYLDWVNCQLRDLPVTGAAQITKEG